MRLEIAGIIIVSFLAACAAPVQYAWQDSREPARESAATDLDECRAYAARQYKPGTPTGEPYLRDAEIEARAVDGKTSGEWRPDRDPSKTTNINAQPIHDIPVDYTGYPGELDYSPHYLDDILEKCMHDRGWRYEPITESSE